VIRRRRIRLLYAAQRRHRRAAQFGAVANDGLTYTNSYAWIPRLSNGLVVDGTAFFDGSALDDLWRRVQPG